MTLRLAVACCFALACGAAPGAEPLPSAQEQAEFVAAARQVALEYTKSLPNFLCTQIVRRHALTNLVPRGLRDPVMWKLADVLKIEVGFENGHERYSLSEVNGKPSDGSHAIERGVMSTGEFGANLLRVFATDAGFLFEHWTTLRGRAAAVYSYTVTAPEAHYQLTYLDHGALRTSAAGLHGEIAIDRKTHGVLRVEYVAVPVAADFAMRATSVVYYDFVKLGEGLYLLPATAVVTARSGKNEIEYRAYRKFSTESQMKFQNPPSEP